LAQDFIRDWDAHLAHEKRRSEHTRRAYVATATRFCAFLSEHRGGAVDGGMLGALTPNDLRAYLATRRAEGLGNASAARELSALRGFLRFVGGSGASVPQMRGPRVKKGLPRPVSPAEALALAQDVEDNARQGWTGARDFALLLLLYGAGLRIGEALGLTGAVLPLGETLRVTGKRNKTRIVPILPAVANAVSRYVEACPFPIAKDSSLFLGARGGPLAPGVIRASVRSARRWGGGAAGAPPPPPPTHSATVSRRICLRAARISGVCRNCSAMRALPRRKSIPRSTPRICSTFTGARTRARNYSSSRPAPG